MAALKVDITAEPLTTSLVSYYTAPNLAETLNTAEITYCVAHNYSASQSSLRINIVKSGGSTGDTNQYYEKLISPNETLPIPLVGRYLKTGDQIYASSSIATSINLDIAVKETSA